MHAKFQAISSTPAALEPFDNQDAFRGTTGIMALDLQEWVKLLEKFHASCTVHSPGASNIPEFWG